VALRRAALVSFGAALVSMLAHALAAAADVSSVVGVLEALRAQGVNVLYSSDLVSPDMKAPPAPADLDPLVRAQQALAAHGLVLRNIGPDRYIVTQAPSRSAESGSPLPAAIPKPVDPVEVSVYASRYDLGGEDLGEPRFLTTTQIEQVPGSQDDVLRAVRVIPGVASNLSTRPYIRGSFVDDILVQFDGVPLADPFHLKNFQSPISAFDPAAVERIEVYSGGFPVRYGTKSGGVIDIKPRSLSSGYENAVGVSLLAYDAATVGHADDWPIDWLATVRHSVPDVSVKPVNTLDGEPRFLDSLGRLRWHGDDGSAWTLGWLLLDDQISLATEAADEATRASYRDEYAWLAYEGKFGDRVQSRTVLAGTWAERSRTGALDEPALAMEQLQESRRSSSVELRSFWTYTASTTSSWSYGIEATHSSANLRYDRTGRFDDLIAASFGRDPDNTLITRAEPEVATYAGSVAARQRWSSMEAELGLRLDAQHYDNSGLGLQWSPRLNVRYDLAHHWRLYGSWGRFTQAQRVDEWRLEESQIKPDPAALAVHTVLGLAYDDREATRVTVEIYRKRWTEVRPYFDNLLDALSLIPDLQPDRVRIAPRASEAAGLELSVRHSFGRSLEAWAGYSVSRVADDFTSVDDVSRSWDQPQALNLGLAWTAHPWSASAVLGWHSGWPRTRWIWTPATESSPESLLIGTRNQARWGNYFTADVSAAWTRTSPRTELSFWLELTNATDRSNECCVHLVSPTLDGGRSVTQPNSWPSRTVNVGVAWRFHGAP
jgi:outer membrane receptor protein involved in Fe transport